MMFPPAPTPPKTKNPMAPTPEKKNPKKQERREAIIF